MITYSVQTVVPKMTSNTTPSGLAFARDIYSAVYDAWAAFDQVDNTEGYASLNGSGGVGFLGYIFVNAKIIGKYSVRSIQGNTALNRMPKDWTFEGSNDTTNGKDGTWTVLDKQVNQSWTSGWTDKDYIIASPRLFKAYRLNWTANNGFANYTDVNELKMYEVTGGLILKKIALKNPNTLKHYSVKDTSLIHLPDGSDASLIAHGIEIAKEVPLNIPFTKHIYPISNSVVLGQGKVFEIDSSSKEIVTSSVMKEVK